MFRPLIHGSMLETLRHAFGHSVVERIRTRSALNPLLWLCGIVVVPSLILTFFASGWAQVFFAGVAAFPILMVALAYALWAVVAPDRIQSEEYLLAQQMLSQGMKGHDVLPFTAQTVDKPVKPLTESDVMAPDAPPVQELEDRSNAAAPENG